MSCIFLPTCQIIALPFCDIVFILQERACFSRSFSFMQSYALDHKTRTEKKKNYSVLKTAEALVREADDKLKTQ